MAQQNMIIHGGGRERERERESEREREREREREMGMNKRPTFPKKKKDCQGFQAATVSNTYASTNTDGGQTLKPYRKASCIKNTSMATLSVLY
jgi:hypothetical protein